MWHAQKEIYSQEREDMEEDHTEEKEDRLHKEQEITVGNTRGQVCSVKVKWVQEETQMQWMWIKEEKRIEFTTYIESRTI